MKKFVLLMIAIWGLVPWVLADSGCQITRRESCEKPDPMVDTWPGQFVGEGVNRKRVWSTRTRSLPAPSAPIAPVAPVAPVAPDVTSYFYYPSLRDWLLLNRLSRIPRPPEKAVPGTQWEEPRY